jgi:hypothetical protein
MKMNEELKKLYGEILKIQNNVCFWNHRYLYDIREYDDDSNKTLTYMVDIFTNYKGGFSEDMDELKWVIGGEYSDHDPEIAIDFAIQLGNELEGDI